MTLRAALICLVLGFLALLLVLGAARFVRWLKHSDPRSFRSSPLTPPQGQPSLATNLAETLDLKELMTLE